MDLTRAIDIYCERTSAAFWAEPINALTNASFIIAAIWAWRYAARREVLTVPIQVSIALVFCIGLGSFLFHTFANALTIWMDIVPIALFTLCAVFLALKWVYRQSTIGALALFGAALLFMAFVGWLSAKLAQSFPLNGSQTYFPAIAILLVLSVLAARRSVQGAHWLAVAAIVFAGALFFRSIDMGVCATIPLGTHFLWHSLNGVVTAAILAFLISAAPKAKPAS